LSLREFLAELGEFFGELREGFRWLFDAAIDLAHLILNWLLDISLINYFLIFVALGILGIIIEKVHEKKEEKSEK
jgi:hypothetical protein